MLTHEAGIKLSEGSAVGYVRRGWRMQWRQASTVGGSHRPVVARQSNLWL